MATEIVHCKKYYLLQIDDLDNMELKFKILYIQITLAFVCDISKLCCIFV